MTAEPLSNIRKRYRGVRVLVLGATGFIGSWLTRALDAAGADLFVAVRDSRRCRQVFENSVSAEVIELDLLDRRRLLDAVSDIAPSSVFNLAGYGVDPRERNELIAWRINAFLPLTLCESLESIPSGSWQGQRLIHVGSALEYGACHNDLGEDTVPMPTTVYGRTKLAGTWALRDVSRSSGMASATVRLFTIYGPGEHHGRLLPSLIDAARDGAALDLTNGNQKRDFTYIEDVAEGLLRLGAVHTPPGEIINLATGRLTTVRRFAEAAAEALRIPPARLRFGALPTRGEEMEHRPVSTSRLRRYVSWAPKIGIKEGICRAMLLTNTGKVNERLKSGGGEH